MLATSQLGGQASDALAEHVARHSAVASMRKLQEDMSIWALASVLQHISRSSLDLDAYWASLGRGQFPKFREVVVDEIDRRLGPHAGGYAASWWRALGCRAREMTLLREKGTSRAMHQLRAIVCKWSRMDPPRREVYPLMRPMPIFSCI